MVLLNVYTQIGCPLLFSDLGCSSESFVVHLESPKECQSRSPILVTVVTICCVPQNHCSYISSNDLTVTGFC